MNEEKINSLINHCFKMGTVIFSFDGLKWNAFNGGNHKTGWGETPIKALLELAKNNQHIYPIDYLEL